MPISPELGAELAKAVSEIYADASATMLHKVARRLERGVDTPGWAEAKLVELHRLREEARALVAELDRLGPEAARQAVEQAAEKGARAAVADLSRAKVTADLVRTSPATVEALARETAGVVRAAHPRILRVAEDVYRSTVAEATGGVSTGAMTRREAAQRALDRFAMRGITGFVDKAGRGWELASYAEMATRTASGHAAIAGYTDQLREHGVDLVYVSTSPYPCSLCDSWEGRVLSREGGNPEYPSMADATSAGLHHPNCTHAVEGYIPGHTDTGRSDRESKERREEGYENKQEQRNIERNIRRWKAREAVALDDDMRQVARKKVREWQAAARDNAEKFGGKRLPYREQVTRAR